MNFKKTVAIVAAAGALSALAIPAMAETTLYGSARMATFYNFDDSPATGKTAGIDEHLQGNARFGIKASNGDVGGQIEYGTGVNVRLLYGTWNFGAGKLTVGQDYTKYFSFADQVHGDDWGLIGHGVLWDGRLPQIRVDMTNGFYVAAIQPNGNVTSGASGNNLEKTANVKIYLPKLNVGFEGKAGTIGYNVGVVAQTMKNATIDEQITAVLGYVKGSAAFGATSLLGSISFAQNAGDMGFNGRKGYDTKTKENSMGIEGFIQAKQKVSDTVSVAAGIGYAGDKYDVSGADKFDGKIALFVNAPITLAKNVSVTPEISYYDALKNAKGDDEKTKAYALGAKWMINF